MNRTNSLLFKTMIPVAIGLGVVAWLFVREFDADQWTRIPWSMHTVLALVLAWICMAGREAGLAWRFRVMTDRDLSWKQSIKVTMLCEFTSAITPTTAGGSALSMVFMNREGIALGRGTTIMMSTLFLDELFFVLACPLVMLAVPYGVIFGFTADNKTFTVGIRAAFWIVYAGICLWTALLYLGIFKKPHAVRRALVAFSKWRLLRRWGDKIVELADNMEVASRDLRLRPFSWWCNAMCATVFTWVCRYLVVNALFWGFAAGASQSIVFARQFVVWTLLTISPTPGGSGLSEWLFANYYGDMIHDVSVALVIAIFWRIISYYVYLAIGAFMVPSWIRKGVGRKKVKNKKV